MKSRNIHLVALLLFTVNSFSQISTKIETKNGIHYITYNMENIDVPLLGTYLFQGAEPVVILSQYGAGFYQLHDKLKRPMIWGLECDDSGALKYSKGFDNAKYTLWFQYTTKSEDDTEDDISWKSVEFTIHFNTLKMFIQGERSKDYKPIQAK